jgi:hypothetical protein
MMAIAVMCHNAWKGKEKKREGTLEEEHGCFDTNCLRYLIHFFFFAFYLSRQSKYEWKKIMRKIMTVSDLLCFLS